MLTLAVFLLAVYGLANAIAMLKIGCYFFGDPTDEIILENGTKIPWKKLADKGEHFEVEDFKGRKLEFKKLEVGRVLIRKGLGRIPYVGDMFYCPACLSFWIGMACSKWFLSPASAVVGVWWKAMLIDGLAACGTTWLLHVLAERLLHGMEETKI
jgi:hypothetical protein